MLRRTMLAILLLAVIPTQGYSQRKKKEEPKSQVLPLPPEPPMALAAETQTLDFHISMPHTGGLAAQIRQSLDDLIRSTHGETIIRLRAFVAGAGDARRVQAEAADIFTERKLPLPVLSVLQVGALGDEGAKVAIEAVVSTHRSVNPNGLAFIAGQTGGNLNEAIEKMAASVKATGIAPEAVLTTTCFTSAIENYGATRETLTKRFPNTFVNVVQALRDPPNDASTCEAVGQLSQKPENGATFLKESRAVLVGSPILIFTGMQLTFGSFLDDAKESFQRLERAAKPLGGAKTAIQVNAYSLNSYASSALRKMDVFPMDNFTLQRVEGLPAIDATAGIEAILTPTGR